MKNRKEIATILLAVVCFSLFAYFIDFSVSKIVGMETLFLKTALQAENSVIGTFLLALNSLIALVFLVLGFMILASYAVSSKPSRKSGNIGLISGIISAAIVLLIFHFSPASFFVAISLVICSRFIIPLARTYEQELKKWKLFRIGSNSSGKVLLIFNILVSIGVLVAVYANMPVYKQEFLDDMSSTISSLTSQQAAALADSYIESYRSSAISTISKNYPDLTPSQRQSMINEINIQAAQIKNTLLSEMQGKTSNASSIAESMPIFKTYLEWLPLITAFTVFVVLEFLRSLVLSNIAGIFSAALIKIYKRI
ncbi:MAG: hypothetical protein HZB67_00075 [Candidatus Aenigmarchaeota archaeon]|nr:hypothetical protein [Candidatus Aenigmarchaeota archaeon]